MAFEGKNPITCTSQILLYEQILEPACHSNSPGCDISYEYDKNVVKHITLFVEHYKEH